MKNTIIVWLPHEKTLKVHAFKSTEEQSLCRHMTSMEAHPHRAGKAKCRMCLKWIAREEKRNGKEETETR